MGGQDPNRPLTPDEVRQYQAVLLASGRGPQASSANVPRDLGELGGPPVSAPKDLGELGGPPVSQPAAPPPLTVAEQFRLDPNRKAPSQGGSILGRSEPVPVEQQGPVSRWFAERANAPSGQPLFQVPSVHDNSHASLPPIPEISPNQLAEQEKKLPPAGPSAPPTGLGNKYANGAPGGTEGGSSDINWNRGGGGVATIPAHEVAVVSAARQRDLTGAIDKETGALEEQKTAIGGSGAAAAEVKKQEAIGEQGIAKATKNVGVDAKLRAQAQADESKAFRAHIDDFSKQVAEEKIDPQRIYHDASTAKTITWTLAKCFGAIGQAFLHTPTNQVADQIEAEAAADVAAQRANHEIHRERLQDMNSAYAHALQVTAHTEDAERLATGYALEAAKHEAAAMTANAQSAVQVKRGEELQAALSERQALIGEKKVEKEISMNPLQQARTVSTGPDMKDVYKSARQYIDDQAKLGTIVPPDAAIRWAYKLHTGTDPLPRAGAFAGGAKSEPGGKQETQIATDEFNRQMTALTSHPVITGSGLGTAAAAHLPQRVAPESNDAQQQLNAINTRNLQAIGKVAKDADGKPNKEMIKKIEERFEIHLSDSPQMKQEKLQGVRDVYNALARQQGASAPEPSGAPQGFKP